MAITFEHDGQNLRVIFKHATAYSHGVATKEELKEYKRTLRDAVREFVFKVPPGLRKNKLVIPLDDDITTDNTKHLAEWRTTSVFIVGEDGIVGNVYTAVCDPFDIYVKEDGRCRALKMLKRAHPDLGSLASRAYGQRVHA